MSSLDAYIDTLEHGKEQFAAEQQGLEFYAEYAGVIAERGSEFARKVKERGSWQTAGWAEEDLDTLAKPLHDHNAARQTSHSSRDTAINTISAKWGEETADYIRNYNPSEKWAKKVRQAALKWTWAEARALVTESVIRRLESSTRYGTLNRLTTDWDNVTAPGVTRPPMNPVDEARLRRLGISITEPWGDIISGYRAMGRILDGGDASGADNNAGASAGDTSGTGDGGGTGGADNNTNGKNAHAKAGFSIYNIAGANTDADAGDTTGTGDAGGTGDADNNTDGKNAYAKAGFSTYNIAGANADAGAGDTTGTGEEVSNNTNNTGEGQSGRVGGADKGGLGRTDEGGVGGTDIEAGVGVGGADKGGVGGADIEAGKKAGAGAIASTDNSADGGDKVTDRHAGLAGLAFAALAAADCADNSNLAVPEGTPSGAATSTSDEFLATFAALANTTLERESKVCESNPFLFAANHQ